MKRRFSDKVEKVCSITLIIAGIIIITTYAFAGGVTDTNNGSAGDILIHSGETHGANDRGTWTDSSSFKGEKGDAGQDGEVGSSGDQGNKGVAGSKGKQGVRGATGKGLKDAYELQIEGVLKETKRTAWSLYFIHDFNNDINTVGAKVKVYIGQSYSDQVREELEKRLKKLEKLVPEVNLVEKDNMEVVPTAMGFKIQKKIDF